MEGHRPRVLVVEDSDAVRHLLCVELEGAGYQVEGARDGSEALLRMSDAEHDLVLTDYRLPGIDGLQVLQAVKTGWPQTPVVVVSGEGMECESRALGGGAYAWVEKPWNRTQLLQTIQAALRSAPVFQSRSRVSS